MKVRNGFVSNSSSSSFICEICNRTEVFHDSISPRDMGFITCENGHSICDEHLLSDINTDHLDEDNEDHEDLISEIDSGYNIPEKHCPICQYEELSYSNMRNYFLKTTSYTIEEVFVKIKEINKRRKKVYNNEYVEYVLKAMDITADDMLNKLKTEYPKYTDFMQAMRNL